MRKAVDLYRAEPLAGLAGAAFEAARRRLSEDRAAALEVLAEIRIECGEHHALVPELVRLVAEFPLHEQMHRLLMLALYHCGRQAEALTAYQEARRMLADEYGVEPGDMLQQTYLRILRSDPSLAGNARSTTTPQFPNHPATAGPALPSWPPAPPDLTHVDTRIPPWLIWLGHAAAALVTMFSWGLLGWGVVAGYAGLRRSWRLGLAAAGYLVLLVIVIGIAVATPDTGNLRPVDLLAISCWVVTWAGSTAHVAAIGLGRAKMPP